MLQTNIGKIKKDTFGRTSLFDSKQLLPLQGPCDGNLILSIPSLGLSTAQQGHFGHLSASWEAEGAELAAGKCDGCSCLNIRIGKGHCCSPVDSSATPASQWLLQKGSQLERDLNEMGSPWEKRLINLLL